MSLTPPASINEAWIRTGRRIFFSDHPGGHETGRQSARKVPSAPVVLVPSEFKPSDEISVPGAGEVATLLIIPGFEFLVSKIDDDRRSGRPSPPHAAADDGDVPFLPRGRPFGAGLTSFEIGIKIRGAQLETRRAAVDDDSDVFPVGFSKQRNPEQSSE